MPVYKDKKKGTWFVVTRFKDWTGEVKTTTKRGFKTQKEAKDYEAAFKLKQDRNLDMYFGDFVDIYFNDMENRVRENTLNGKRYIIELKIRPYFEKRKINKIVASDIIEWQNQLLAHRKKDGDPYSPVYLKTVHNQLSAIFNHAVKFYGLKENPARIAGNMGKEKSREIEFWTKEEYLIFSKAMMKKDGVYQAFELLYWCGLRLGELLALTKNDFNFKRDTVSITKSLQRINREDVITSPKTEKSIRTIKMPHFLSEEIQDYIRRLFNVEDDERIFPFTKSMMHHEMDRGCKETGVKRIKIHSLRHSHISYLFLMGFSAVEIGNRVGHESADITFRYAHLFPNRDSDIADRLNDERGNPFDVTKE